MLGVSASVVIVPDPPERWNVRDPRQQPLGRRCVQGELTEVFVTDGHLAVLAAVPPLPRGAGREGEDLEEAGPGVELGVLLLKGPAPGDARWLDGAVVQGDVLKRHLLAVVGIVVEPILRGEGHRVEWPTGRAQV